MPEAEALLRQYVEWFGEENVVVELQHNLVHGDTRRIDRAGPAGRRGSALPTSRPATSTTTAASATGCKTPWSRSAHRTTLDGCPPRAAAEPRVPPALRRRRWPRCSPTTRRRWQTTLAIAERCAAFDLARDLGYRFPGLPDDPTARRRTTAPGAICRDGAATPLRSGTRTAGARQRLKEELQLIAKHELAGFFLIYRDLLELAQEVAARSAASSPARAARTCRPGVAAARRSARSSAT